MATLKHEGMGILEASGEKPVGKVSAKQEGGDRGKIRAALLKEGGSNARARQALEVLVRTPWEKQDYEKFKKTLGAIIEQGDIETIWKVKEYYDKNKVHDAEVERAIVEHGSKEDRTRLMDEVDRLGYDLPSLRRVMWVVLESPNAAENVDDLIGGMHELLRARRVMQRDPNQKKFMGRPTRGSGGWDLPRELDGSISGLVEKISALKGGESLGENAEVQEIQERVLQRKEEDRRRAAAVEA